MNAKENEKTQKMEKFCKTKAHQRYLLEGVPVPGVTTVLGLLNKPALLHWAWELGRNGVDYRKAKDAAADIGTIAHWIISCHLNAVKPDTSEFSQVDLGKAEKLDYFLAVIKFLSWWDGGKFSLVATEMPLVSKSGFGGTLDIVAEKDGEFCLVDLKTSKAIYPEYWTQVAAYGLLWGENNPEKNISKFVICRIGKENTAEDFEVQEKSDLTQHVEFFRNLLRVWQTRPKA